MNLESCPVKSFRKRTGKDTGGHNLECVMRTSFPVPLCILLLVSVGIHPLFADSGPKLFSARPAQQSVTLTGYTRARRIMDLVSKEAGYCSQVRFDIGEAIDASGVFALLDTTFIDIAIQQNRNRQQQLVNRVEYLSKVRNRYDRLVIKKSANQATLDEWQYQLDQAGYELKTLKLEGTDLLERRKRFQVKGGAGWRIISRQVEPGEWVTPGSRLGRAGDFQTLLVPFALSEQEYAALDATSANGTLHLPSEGLSIPARIERIHPDFDPQTRKRTVELAVSKPVFLHRGGIKAELELILPDLSGAVLVPKSALLKSYEEYGLIRPDGQRVNVLYLGPGPRGQARVNSPRIKPGDSFQLHPRSN